MKLRQCAYFMFGLVATVVFVTEANKCSSCYPIKSIPPCPPTSAYKSAPISKVSKNPPAITKPVVVKVEQKEIKTIPTPEAKPIVPAEKPKQPETKPVEAKPAEIKPEIQQPTEQKKNGGQVYSVGSLEELNKYIQENDKVIIDIYASWCGPCKQFAPIYEEFAQKHPDIKCLKIDGEKVPAVRTKYNVTGYPTFVLYKNKQKVERFSSASQSLSRFEERVKVLLT